MFILMGRKLIKGMQKERKFYLSQNQLKYIQHFKRLRCFVGVQFSILLSYFFNDFFSIGQVPTQG